MTDIEKSFTFLHANIPQWLTALTDVESKVASVQSEVSRIPIAPVKRKTESMESMRDAHMSAIPEEHSTQPSRKRKSTSVLSTHASGPSKYRSRCMIVVHYDGDLQKSFETLVRNIGTGRNLLRKAKMAAKMEALADLASADSSEEDDDDDDPTLSKIGYRHRTGLSGIRAARARQSMGASRSGTGSSPEIFDTTDKALEQAQGLCETAAHKSLRDGNCRNQLNGVRKSLEHVFEIATKETTRYAANKDSEDLNKGPKTELSPLMDISPKPVSMAPIATPAITRIASKQMEIEVDDEDDDDDYIMPPIRLTSRLTARV